MNSTLPDEVRPPQRDMDHGTSFEYNIREIRESEYPVLEEFLYEAIFIPEGTLAPSREIINKPELQVYIADFVLYNTFQYPAFFGPTLSI